MINPSQAGNLAQRGLNANDREEMTDLYGRARRGDRFMDDQDRLRLNEHLIADNLSSQRMSPEELEMAAGLNDEPSSRDIRRARREFARNRHSIEDINAASGSGGKIKYSDLVGPGAPSGRDLRGARREAIRRSRLARDREEAIERRRTRGY